jgi:glucose-6-phosphate 1-dehydrogenase
MALLLAEPRTASIRTRQQCDLLALDKADFTRVLRDHPEFARPILEACRERYRVTAPDHAFDRQVIALLG